MYGISLKLEKAIGKALKTDWKIKQDIADIAGCTGRTVQESSAWKNRKQKVISLGELAATTGKVLRAARFRNLVTDYVSDVDDLLIVTFPGDVHMGSIGCDETRFKKAVKLVNAEPRLKMITMGDMITNVHIRSVGPEALFEQTITPQQQLTWLEKKIKQLGPNLLWYWLGNHEDRTLRDTGMDVVGWLVNRLGVNVMNGPNVIDIKVGDYVYSGKLSHKSKQSINNPFQGPLSLYKSTRKTLHFCGCGHIHKKATGKVADCLMFVNGTDECLGTGYGEQYGNDVTPSYPTIVFHGDKHKAMLFDSISDALQYARSLKKKVIKYVGDI